MKLTQEQIEKIEAFLTDRETMTLKEIAEKKGIPFGTVCGMATAFVALGIVEKKKIGNLASVQEIAEFRAWKAAQKQAAE